MIRAFALAALTFGGCAATRSDAPATPPTAETSSADPTGARPVRIALGTTADVAGLPVRFVEVAGDSRCPENVTCVWEGRATVRLVVGGMETVLTVPHGGEERPEEPQSVVHDGSRLRVLALRPYPGSAEAEGGAPVEVEVEVLPD